MKKAISQDEMRRIDGSRPPRGGGGDSGYYQSRESSYRGGPPYGGGGRSGGYDPYRMPGEFNSDEHMGGHYLEWYMMCFN